MTDGELPLPEVEDERTYHGWLRTADGGAVRAENIEAVLPSGEDVILRSYNGNEYTSEETVIEDVLADLVRHKDERPEKPQPQGPQGPPPKKR